MLLLSSACTQSSSPPKAESESLFIPLGGRDSTCSFLQRRRLTSQSMSRKTGWMYPTPPNSMWPPFYLDTNDLPLQLWSNDGSESIFDHHTPWQLHWGRFLHCASLESTYFWCYWYLFVNECSLSVGTLTSPTRFPGFIMPYQNIASCWQISIMMTNQSTASLMSWSNFSCGKPQMTYQTVIAQSTCYILS